MKKPQVFVSMGTPYNDEQIQFRQELEQLLRNKCSVDPRIIGLNEYPPGNPLDHVRGVMRQCNGVIVVACERKYVENGKEKRGSTDERPLSGQKYTTPWNHIESAIAYSLQLPIYIIAETGLTEEGLIESKADWFVQKIDLSASSLQSQHVIESIRSWVKKRVTPHSKKSRRAILPAIATLKFSELTTHELYVLYTFLGTVFGIGVLVGTVVQRLGR